MGLHSSQPATETNNVATNVHEALTCGLQYAPITAFVLMIWHRGLFNDKDAWGCSADQE